MTTPTNAITTEQEQLDPHSAEGKLVLDSRSAAAEPCRIHDAKHGFTILVFEINGREPEPIFQHRRVLFYGCSQCSEERRRLAMPGCPPGHRAWRHWNPATGYGCQACQLALKNGRS